MLDSEFQHSLINSFVPYTCDALGILTAGELSGAFTNVADGERLDTIDSLGSFLVHYGPGSAFSPNRIFLTNVELNARPGDFNDDNVIDAAGYVVWRKTDGTEGATIPSGLTSARPPVAAPVPVQMPPSQSRQPD